MIHLAVPPPPVTPQTITLHVIAAPAAAPVQAAVAPPSASAPAAVLAELRHPGPIRFALGSLGEQMARLKYDRVIVPPASTTAAVQPVVYQVAVPAPAPAAAVIQAPQAVLASPQSTAPTFRSLFRIR